MNNSFTKSRKFKYGSVATAFTVAFIAIVVIFNVIFTALARKYNWFIDLTAEQVYTLSDEAKELLSDIPEEVDIIFASDPDVLMNGSNASYTRMIYTTALQIEESFPNIHVTCENVFKNPGFFREYYNTAATDIDSDSVVVASGGEVRVFTAQAFFSFSDLNDPSTVWAYNGEKKMISGIMAVTQTDKPIVAFTTQHGEDIPGALPLYNVFAENGFTVEAYDLTKDEIDDDCRVLVVYNPIYDFIGGEAEDQSTNEIEKIDKFLDGYGCLMVFCSPEYVDNLTNLNEFLAEWGISYVGSTTIRDKENAMSVDGFSIIAEYQKDTLGGSIYRDLNDLATPPKTIIRNSAPIEILWEKGGGLDGSRDVSPVLKSHETSELMDGGLVKETGSYNVVTLSREMRLVDNEDYYSYVIAFGSPSFSNLSYIDSNAYANEDILSAAMKAVGREKVLAVLKRKPFDKDEITITTDQANNWTVAMTLVLPAIVSLCGLVIITRRKHS